MDAERGPAAAGVGRSRPRGDSGTRQRGLRHLCRLLLESTPAVCLFVRPENEPAIRLYDTIGMRRVGAYRSVLF